MRDNQSNLASSLQLMLVADMLRIVHRVPYPVRQAWLKSYRRQWICDLNLHRTRAHAQAKT